jgi:hypothetical protein
LPEVGLALSEVVSRIQSLRVDPDALPEIIRLCADKLMIYGVFLRCFSIGHDSLLLFDRRRYKGVRARFLLRTTCHPTDAMN